MRLFKFNQSRKSLIKRFNRLINIISPGESVYVDGLEILTDEVLEGIQNELVSEIPIIKLLNAGRKIKNKINDEYEIQKFKRFFYGYSKIDEELKEKVRTAFVENKIEDKKKLVENILIAISRLDQIDKVDALMKLFLSYIEGNITNHEYLRYCYVLDKIDLSNIDYLKSFYQVSDSCELNFDLRENFYLIQSFAFLGLVDINFGENKDLELDVWSAPSVFTPGGFIVNIFGLKFLKILYELDLDCELEVLRIRKRNSINQDLNLSRKKVILTKKQHEKSRFSRGIYYVTYIGRDPNRGHIVELPNGSDLPVQCKSARPGEKLILLSVDGRSLLLRPI